MSIFEQASRKKLRFATSVGSISVEDLWDLPLSDNRRENLNNIAIALHRSLQDSALSFVDEYPKTDSIHQLRFDIVKHIIEVKLGERKAAEEAEAKAQRKQKLLAVLSRKEDAALEEMSPEDIRALIEQT